MKLGILTYHSQLNYGGVLQCWALKTSLEEMGHEVVVVDRWILKDNSLLKRQLASLSWRVWGKLLFRGVWGCGDFWMLLRAMRTIRFVRALGLTKTHFHQWRDVDPSAFLTVDKLDCLIVGSDQIWNGQLGDPRPYLLEGAPLVRAISYAASFGMKDLPAKYDYAAGFRRFAAISVREKEGAALVKKTGYPGEVKHVVDPTLLVEPEAWRELLGHASSRQKPKTLVCYFLSQSVAASLHVLEEWAKERGWTVKVLNDGYLKRLPKSFSELIFRLKEMFGGMLPSRVRLCSAYGPKEFVRAFATADAVITDSFHAVMFSAVFGCNLRFLRPELGYRREMFARIEEFAAKAICGHWLVDSLPQALASLIEDARVGFCDQVISMMRKDSHEWLKDAISSDSGRNYGE